MTAADDSELRACLRSCAATRSLAGGVLTRIEGGLGNRAWRVDAHGESWFARLGHPGAERLGVDRVSERALLQCVSAAGLAPGIRACEPATGFLVTRFVAARTWSADDARSALNAGRVAERLRCLHGLPMPADVRTVDYRRQARHLAASLPAPDEVAAALAVRAAAAFARIGDRPSATVLCHNDLHHLNLLDDGTQLWLIDWEYGGRGDPLFDVAGFLALHDLDRVATGEFLRSYGRMSAAVQRHLDDARWLFDYVQWLWYRLRFPDATGWEGGHASGLARRLLRCDN